MVSNVDNVKPKTKIRRKEKKLDSGIAEEEMVVHPKHYISFNFLVKKV